MENEAHGKLAMEIKFALWKFVDGALASVKIFVLEQQIIDIFRGNSNGMQASSSLLYSKK